MKRGRNQRRRQGGVNPNRALDSNGPDVRIRGTANQIYDKYVALARDASSAGDRVKAESYLQHAEHYFRVIRSMQPPAQTQGAEGEGEQPSVADDGENAGGNQRSNNGRRDRKRDDARSDRRNEAADDIAAEETASEPAAASAEDDQPVEAEAEEKPKPKRRRTRRTTKASADAPAEKEAEAPVEAAAAE